MTDRKTELVEKLIATAYAPRENKISYMTSEEMNEAAEMLRDSDECCCGMCHGSYIRKMI